MAICKCKMCGGDLNITELDKVVECEYCGTTQTVPSADSEKKMTLFNRANRLRLNNEFDKSAGIYESIIAEFPEEAEAYWGIVLCKYGIEYVDDPATGKKIPTCHRSSFDSVLEDDSFEQACDNADAVSRRLYREEAKKIEDIRKGIIEVSSKEEPYDIFICYKETDENGDRTVDSVIAQDVYNALTEKGYRVFFSRISLEDKLGQEYEPYIFSALNSAKIMLVFGTDFEYFNAVWVKNEWSRFLMMIEAGQKKTLIPCYKDLDAYDMPKEFAKLQAQDMGKVGAMQDLLAGIDKIMNKGAKATASAKSSGDSATVDSLLKRAFMFLMDKDWASADEYAEKVLDIDPENAQAYLAKLMAELQVRSKYSLSNHNKPFDNNSNYRKAVRFADEKFKNELKNYSESAKYNIAVKAMEEAENEKEYISASRKFEAISGIRDADVLAKQCLEKAEVCRKDAIYAAAKSTMKGDKTSDCEEAIKLFRTISGWKDTDEKIAECQKKIEEIKAKEEADRLERERQEEERRFLKAKRNKKISIIFWTVLLCLAVIIVLINVLVVPVVKYNSALSCIDSGKYIEAYDTLSELDYKDSKEIQNEIRVEYYKEVLSSKEEGDYFSFGTYNIDNDLSDGKESILWKVLEKTDEGILLITDRVIDSQPFDDTYEDVSWEDCSLRKWLNNTFMNEAFSTEEQKMIQSIFLLGESSLEEYFYAENSRRCMYTTYAKARGIFTNDLYSDYWTGDGSRKFFGSYYCKNVNWDGKIVSNTSPNSKNGVRPAMRVSFE